MKNKVLKVLFVSLFLLLFSCNKTIENNYDIKGKTFYITSYDNQSKLWLANDNSFVLIDDTNEIKGNWTISDNVLTLNKDNETILFEIKDDNNLILKSTLNSCGFDDIFSSDEKYANKTPVSNTNSLIFKNASSNNQASIEIKDDKTFTLIENEKEINGLWGMSESNTVYMFSNFDSFKDFNGNDIHNFEFIVYDDKTLILNEDLISSKKYDQFTIDGKINKAYQDMSIAPTTQKWIHEPYNDIVEQYLPTLTIAEDNSFSFMENTYSGMGFYKGYCQRLDDGWGCDVVEADTMQGYKGSDVKYIEFKYDEDGKTLILQTELCSSLPGHKFNLQDN